MFRRPLPQPLHGWRAFLGEVGVIVLGVLIALAFGQVAQWFNERSEAADARESIRDEMRENLWWLDYRQRLEPCLGQRLTALNDILAKARAGQPFVPVTAIAFPFHAKVTSLRWEANAAAGRASLFSGQEQRLLGNMYYTTDEFQRSQDREETLWAQAGFVDGLTRLAPDDQHDLALILAELRARDARASLLANRAGEWAKQLSLVARNPDLAEGAAEAAPGCPPLSSPGSQPGVTPK